MRIYIPLDLNKDAIIRRLGNESEFRVDVNLLIYQIEIYDQVWYVRHMPKEGRHSKESIELVEAFVKKLEDIPDGCTECFPFETIDELKKEYLETDI